jgi:hypothetical protein
VRIAGMGTRVSISRPSARSESSISAYFATLRLQANCSARGTGAIPARVATWSPGSRTSVLRPWRTWTSPSITPTREPRVPWSTEKIVPVTATRQSGVCT